MTGRKFRVSWELEGRRRNGRKLSPMADGQLHQKGGGGKKTTNLELGWAAVQHQLRPIQTHDKLGAVNKRLPSIQKREVPGMVGCPRPLQVNDKERRRLTSQLQKMGSKV